MLAVVLTDASCGTMPSCCRGHSCSGCMRLWPAEVTGLDSYRATAHLSRLSFSTTPAHLSRLAGLSLCFTQRALCCSLPHTSPHAAQRLQPRREFCHGGVPEFCAGHRLHCHCRWTPGCSRLDLRLSLWLRVSCCCLAPSFSRPELGPRLSLLLSCCCGSRAFALCTIDVPDSLLCGCCRCCCHARPCRQRGLQGRPGRRLSDARTSAPDGTLLQVCRWQWWSRSARWQSRCSRQLQTPPLTPHIHPTSPVCQTPLAVQAHGMRAICLPDSEQQLEL